ncbi:MAG: sugar ABC transporter permease [Verrucomicrobia bacterium]|nr:sugar ABC transporter permease [Verrucomicrobiota bacterium]
MNRRSWIAWLFLLPNLLGFLVFTSLPVLASFGLAFCSWDLFSPPKFVGLKNFIQLLGNPRFWEYLYNTLYLMMGIPFGMMGSLFLAILLDQKLPARALFRLTFFIPCIVSGVGTLILWKWIFNSDYGLVNNLLWSGLGIEGPKWLESTAWAKPAIVIMGFWGAVGGPNMILYLAALQSVSPELYEAADMDGANFWQRFWHITWPMVSPTTFFILTMGIIGGFEGGFDAAYVMTKGGPAGSTTPLSYFIYQNAFQFFYMGKAAAASWALFAMVLAFTLLNWRCGGRRVHY